MISDGLWVKMVTHHFRTAMPESSRMHMFNWDYSEGPKCDVYFLLVAKIKFS